MLRVLVRPSVVTAFFLGLGSVLWAQGVVWFTDLDQAIQVSQNEGRAILVLISTSEDPFLGAQSPLGQLVVAWVARVYWPLRVTHSEFLKTRGIVLRQPIMKIPCLIIINPLLHERARLENPSSPLELREFLRRWTTMPLLSVAPSQAFKNSSQVVFQGDGEGLWRSPQNDEIFWEWGQTGPYLILNSINHGSWALPIHGGWSYYRPSGLAQWERAVVGGFE